MLKYFSSAIEEPINTGGRKLMYDMQRTIKKFLTQQKIDYKEYNFGNLRNAVHLALPSPYSKYLLFGYLGNPFLTPPFVIVFSFVLCLVALKKRIAREKIYLIVLDLIEWQSTLSLDSKDAKHAIFRIFQCFLERTMISYVADEIISLVDREFMTKNYRVKNIKDLEFLDYYTDLKPSRNVAPKNLKLLYAGELGSRKGFHIESLEDILINLDGDHELILVARGMEDKVEKRLGRFNNFRFIGQLKAEELDKIARECHFGLILYSPKYMYYNIMPPIKLSFYVANGLTVISTNLARIKQLNDKYDFGYALDRGEMIRFIESLSPDRIKRLQSLQEQIASGTFLYNTLKKLDLG